MNETTEELIKKIETLFDEYAFDDVEAGILKKEINELIDNYC